MASVSREDFNNKIFKRIYDLNNEYQLVCDGELIVVAVSGGKDSLLTLHSLKSLQEDIDFDMVGVCVDEGIKGYRESGLEAARHNCQELGVELVEKSFKEETGFCLDDIYSDFKSACIPCGVFRRYILNKSAYNLGGDKIATGHNLDDEIQSFLMSFARGDTFKFAKFGPKLNRIHEKMVPRIKPLWSTPEKEVGLWAVLNDIDVHFEECPYSKLSLRAKTKNFLNQGEESMPGLKENIMESFKKSLKSPDDIFAVLNECVECGEPTSAHLCKACELKKELYTNKRI